MKINIEVTEESAVMTVKIGKETFTEKRIPLDFNETNLDSKTIIDQMHESGIAEEFIESFENAVGEFMLHDLLCLAYEWND